MGKGVFDGIEMGDAGLCASRGCAGHRCGAVERTLSLSAEVSLFLCFSLSARGLSGGGQEGEEASRSLFCWDRCSCVVSYYAQDGGPRPCRRHRPEQRQGSAVWDAAKSGVSAARSGTRHGPPDVRGRPALVRRTERLPGRPGDLGPGVSAGGGGAGRRWPRGPSRRTVRLLDPPSHAPRSEVSVNTLCGGGMCEELKVVRQVAGNPSSAIFSC